MTEVAVRGPDATGPWPGLADEVRLNAFPRWSPLISGGVAVALGLAMVVRPDVSLRLMAALTGAWLVLSVVTMQSAANATACPKPSTRCRRCARSRWPRTRWGVSGPAGVRRMLTAWRRVRDGRRHRPEMSLRERLRRRSPCSPAPDEACRRGRGERWPRNDARPSG
jgi:hypothetical protein